MKDFIFVYIPLLLTPVFSANADTGKVVKTVSYEHILNWSIGLVIVLALFFGCIWLMRKMGSLPMTSRDNMKIVAGLSLGMREKLVLVQVGEKQLVLGVTPGRIDNLLILEGSEQLFQDNVDTGDFSKTLSNILTRNNNE